MEGYTAAEVSAELPENSRMTCDHTQRDEFRAARITELAIVADHLLADSVRRAMPLKPQPLQMDKSSLCGAQQFNNAHSRSV